MEIKINIRIISILSMFILDLSLRVSLNTTYTTYISISKARIVKHNSIDNTGNFKS